MIEYGGIEGEKVGVLDIGLMAFSRQEEGC